MLPLLLLSLIFTVLLVWYVVTPLFDRGRLRFCEDAADTSISLGDLEEDFRTGKLSQEDYERMKVGK